MTATQPKSSDDLGAVIRQQRVALDITKAEAARRAGVSRRTWHEVEEGQRHGSSSQTLALFEEALQLKPGTLESLTPKSADREVEVLRRRFTDLISTFGLVEMRALMEQAEGLASTDLRAELAALRASLEALRRDVAERIAVATPAAPEPPTDVGRGRGSGRSRRSRSIAGDP